MGRYKFNNRGTGTIFWLFFFIQWRIQGGGGDRWSPPPLELVPILKTYCKVFVTGTDRPPPLECGWPHIGNVQGGGGACECPRVGVFLNFSEGGWRHADNVEGGLVLVNVQGGGVFQFSGGRMTSRRQCPRGGGLWNVSPPPSGNPVSAPVICVKFRANQPLCPPPQSVPIRLWLHSLRFSLGECI